MLEKLEAIVMRTKDYGETHKIVTIFSKKRGKLTAIARGANKPKSKMAAITQPFIYGDFLIYINTRGLSTMQQGDVMYSLRKIREDIVKTAYAAYIVELTEKMLDTLSPNPYIYDQLYFTLKWINNNEDPSIPIMMYELKLYDMGGFAPIVDRCSACGVKAGSFLFSIREGGLLCTQCCYLDRDAVSLPDTLARLLYIFSTTGLERVGSINIKEKNKQLLRQLFDAYYDRYGGYYIKSRKFLNQIDLLK